MATTDAAAPNGAPALRGRERVEGLLARMTLQEKVSLLHQYAPAIPRLGLPAFRTGTEALHGVAWLGPATVFPQAVGLGATWDPALLRRVGRATAIEVRGKHAADPRVGLLVWAPVVNLLRDPRWGRNEEGYSEDVLLTVTAAGAFCEGLCGDDPDHLLVAPLLKHYLAYNHENERDTTSAGLRARVLHEYDLPVFTDPLRRGVAAGVMPAYNLVNGRPNHVSPLLDLLRAQVGGGADAAVGTVPAAPGATRTVDGDDLVMCSDAEAPSNLVETERYFEDHATAHAAALRAGIDSFTDHDTDSGVTTGRLGEALERGLISEWHVERAARRLLTLRARLGDLDPAEDPHASLDATVIDTPEHRALALEAARAQVVLLRNEDALLPLPLRDPTGERTGPAAGAASGAGSGAGSGRRTRRVAVVGPYADTLCHDWYSGTMPYRVTVADGIREALAAARPQEDPADQVVCVEGVDRVRLRSVSTGACVRVVEGPAPEVVVDGALPADEILPADPALAADGGVADPTAEQFDLFSWGEGRHTLRSVATGRYVARAASGRLVADSPAPGGWVAPELFTLREHAGGVVLHCHVSRTDVRLAATGGLVAPEASEDLGAPDPDGAPEAFTVEVLRSGREAALAAAEGADDVVVVVGNDPHVNGRETEDRTTLALPPAQEELLRILAQAHPRVVLVVMSSYPYSVTWAQEHVASVLWTSHAGQETGHAVADVLFGRCEPSGRLPQTWYRTERDLPDLLEYDVIKARRTYQYFEGDPLYPFGHGLTYTTFEHGPAVLVQAPPDPDAHDPAATGPVDEAGHGPAGSRPVVRVEVPVTNTGDRPGTETVQLYARPPAGYRDLPRRRLLAFARLALAPGGTGTAVLEFPLSALAVHDVVERRMAVLPGTYELLVGASCLDIRSTVSLHVPGEAPGPRPVTGRVLPAVDFDDYEGVELVDVSRESGDAVAVRGEGAAWVLFRDADLRGADGGVPGRLVARVARVSPGCATLELRRDDPGRGRLLAAVEVPSTGDGYRWADVATDVVLPRGVYDLYVVMRGEQRLESLRWEATPRDGDPAARGA